MCKRVQPLPYYSGFIVQICTAVPVLYAVPVGMQPGKKGRRGTRASRSEKIFACAPRDQQGLHARTKAAFSGMLGDADALFVEEDYEAIRALEIEGLFELE